MNSRILRWRAVRSARQVGEGADHRLTARAGGADLPAGPAPASVDTSRPSVAAAARYRSGGRRSASRRPPWSACRCRRSWCVRWCTDFQRPYTGPRQSLKHLYDLSRRVGGEMNALTRTEVLIEPLRQVALAFDRRRWLGLPARPVDPGGRPSALCLRALCGADGRTVRTRRSRRAQLTRGFPGDIRLPLDVVVTWV